MSRYFGSGYLFSGSQYIILCQLGNLSDSLLILQAYCAEECVGAIVCKLDQHRKNVWRGYIAMLVVEKKYRRHKIGLFHKIMLVT